MVHKKIIETIKNFFIHHIYKHIGEVFAISTQMSAVDNKPVISDASLRTGVNSIADSVEAVPSQPNAILSSKAVQKMLSIHSGAGLVGSALTFVVLLIIVIFLQLFLNEQEILSARHKMKNKYEGIVVAVTVFEWIALIGSFISLVSALSVMMHAQKTINGGGVPISVQTK